MSDVQIPRPDQDCGSCGARLSADKHWSVCPPDPCVGRMRVTSFCCGHGTATAFCVTEDESGRYWHWQPREEYPEPVVVMGMEKRRGPGNPVPFSVFEHMEELT